MKSPGNERCKWAWLGKHAVNSSRNANVNYNYARAVYRYVAGKTKSGHTAAI